MFTIALQHSNNLVSEKFFRAVGRGYVFILEEIVAQNEHDVVAEIVNSLNSQGETPLLVAIKGQHFDMVKYLVECLKADIRQMGRVWNVLDSMTVPFLFVAMLYDSSQNQDIINYLMDQDAGNNPPIILTSIKSSSIPLQDKVDILKVVGAAYLLRAERNEDDARFVIFGKKYWNEAMALRSESNNTIQIVPTKFSEWATNVDGMGEFTTMEELERVEWEIGEHQLMISTAFFRFQALLIVDRIGNRILRGPHPYFLLLLIKRAYDFSLQFENLFLFLNMLIVALEMLRHGEWELVINSESGENVAYNATYFFAGMIVNSLRLPPTDHRKLSFARVMEVLSYLSEFHFNLLQNPVAKVSLTAKAFCQGILGLFDIVPLFNLEETKEFKQWLGHYQRLINCHSGVCTLLHAVCQLPFSFQFISLLLGAGADPVASDERGQAPLHYLFRTSEFKINFESACNKFQLILNAGAHMDQLNSDGKTPMDICKSRLGLKIYAIVKRILPLSLSCFCAQVISRNKIPFKDVLPPKLQTFVVLHGSKK